MRGQTTSVIIPVGPGDTGWRDLLPRLDRLPRGSEIIISATTGAVCRADLEALPHRPIWLTGPAGRADQLNRGVARASGDRLWLLHADSLPDAAVVDCAAGLRIDDDEIAWFDLRFHDGPALVRLNAHGATLRSRLLGLPFGDQGWLLARSLFDRLGGFDPALKRGEDLDFIVRARACGVRLKRTGLALATSGRRYLDHGWLSTTARHVRLTPVLWFRARRRVRQTRESRA